MLSALFNLLAGNIADWAAHRAKVSQARELARIESVKNGIPGWSDEFLVVVWSYPVIASFVPQLQPSVTAGFEFMSTMPEWYVAGFMTVSAGVFGFNKFMRWKK